MWRASAPSARARAGQRSDLAGVNSYLALAGTSFTHCKSGFCGCAQTFRLDRAVWID